MSSTLSSASTLDPLSVYYGNNIPAQMSAVRNGYLRDLHETVADLMNKINLQSPEGVQRLRDAEETIFQTSRTETGEYVCRDHQATHQHIRYRCLNCNQEFRFMREYEQHHSVNHEGDMNLELVNTQE